ncbi:MAG: DUF1722 domain-containing protein [candidate division KSB1 bacterium]|nr:DUF1722 domain-containing protein [candidate division KSB1 bacterium]MDZ7275181.1 DUF1722 domain-containing protein [candidate division KSB1 bacterium]MDZ7287350.1 DUF1722 domain-containing protein [candidate division KSB1 bacterium]MDZ7299464.1 DUF1722 domain-containing protein [candidate division KSB1 bacterium]MDZ7305490.1 DUF1722 domain-containing protein [candidate division KSB1 bacterium]
MNTATTTEKIRLGISSCLLGQNVRFDGGHKKDHYITTTLAQFFEWVPVCPEMEIGLGAPRESLHLIGKPEAPRLVTTKTGRDYTETMLAYARAKVAQLEKLELHGYLLKKDSPTCGMERVKVYDDNHVPTKTGTGLFARVLLEKMTLLPVEEEGRLNDPRLRENFIVRVFCHYRWRQLQQRPLRRHALVRFHAQHKYLIMAHSPKHLVELGRLVAGAKSLPPGELSARYAELFFAALRRPASSKKHANVLYHLSGYLKKLLDERDKQELQAAIADYQAGLLPLIVPITLLRHYVRKFTLEYLQEQIYLNPHPKELMLLNHV